MSWDYDDKDQWEQDYYDNRCFPEEYDCIEEYKLEHESGAGMGDFLGGSLGTRAHSNATSATEGRFDWLKRLFLMIAFIYACYITLIVLAIFPPIGALFFMGLLKVKHKIYL